MSFAAAASAASAATAPPLVLRPYQSRILSTALADNCLIVLRTGSGKTLVAAHLIASFPDRSLFLVPTCLLVQQQSTALRSVPGLTTPGAVLEYQGGNAAPCTAFRCLVSTPAAFASLQSRSAGSLAWTTFASVVFDEAHHVLKNHPYRKLALALRRDDPDETVRVFGLTASYTYAVSEEKSRASLQRMCDEMRFRKLERAEPGELEASGYHARVAAPEVAPEVAMGGAAEGERPEGVVAPEARKPHLLLATFLDREAKGAITPFAKRVMAVVRCMEAEVCREFAGFCSPVMRKSALRDWGIAAHKMAGRSAKFGEMREWYEALRILVTSWQEAEDGAVWFLRLAGVGDGGAGSMGSGGGVVWGEAVVVTKRMFSEAVPEKYPRFERLKAALLEKLDAVATFRGILFVQQRVTAHILEHFVRCDAELAARLRTACIYAATTPATPTLSVSKTDVKNRIAAFADGSVNLLVATNVAEEGMDIVSGCCFQLWPCVWDLGWRDRYISDSLSFISLLLLTWCVHTFA